MATPEKSPAKPPPLLSLRSALIFFIAVCCGIGVGILTKTSGKSTPEAVLAGLFAAGSVTVACNTMIGTESGEGASRRG
jgi:hypothetical protein